MSSGREYRLIWKREGMRRKFVRFATLAAVQRRLAKLAEFEANPHQGCDHTETGWCYWEGGFCPIVEGPTVESRAIGPWEAAS